MDRHALDTWLVVRVIGRGAIVDAAIERNSRIAARRQRGQPIRRLGERNKRHVPAHHRWRRHWKAAKVPGASDLDFRAVRAFDENTAFLLSIGAGEKSRVYKTADGGASWNLLYTNPDPKGFFDAIAFWDASHGIILGDPVDGRFVVLTTSDGGATWTQQKTPPAQPQEGAFAASNSCLMVRGTREAWFGSGGPQRCARFSFDRRRRDVDRREDADSKRQRLRRYLCAGVFRLAPRNRGGRRLQQASGIDGQHRDHRRWRQNLVRFHAARWIPVGS